MSEIPCLACVVMEKAKSSTIESDNYVLFIYIL